MILIFNLLRLVLWPSMWSILENRTFAFKRLAWLDRLDPPRIISRWIIVSWLGTLISSAKFLLPYCCIIMKVISSGIYTSLQCSKEITLVFTPGGRNCGIHLRILPTTDCPLAILHSLFHWTNRWKMLIYWCYDLSYHRKLVAFIMEARRIFSGTQEIFWGSLQYFHANSKDQWKATGTGKRQDNWGFRPFRREGLNHSTSKESGWSCGFWLWARKTGNKWVKVEAIDVNSDLVNNYRNQGW